MEKTEALSRRDAMRTMGAAVVTCGLAAADARAQAYAPQKQKQLTKAAAHYQDTPKGEAACGACPYFTAPNGCVVVEGEISPNGWCPMFTTFAPLDRGAHQGGR